MSARLALEGGPPVRATPLPYGRHTISADDVDAVTEVLGSDWLTTGPKVDELERAFAERVGAGAAVAVSSGTAALHAALASLGIGPGDEVVVPAMTFVATANCVVFQGATPVFADVDPDTLLLTAATVAERLTERTRAIVAVDYAGQPCAYASLRSLAADHRAHLVADACHSLGAEADGRAVGTLAELSAFSLHPVKAVTAAEGGLVSTGDPELASRMRAFRNHGITCDHRSRAAAGTWRYDMRALGFNYRLSDVQCALAISQLGKLEGWIDARARIAARYDAAFAGMPEVCPLAVRPGVRHAHHLYVVRLRLGRLRAGREDVFRALRAEGIGVGVHYPPAHLHGYYRAALGTHEGQCPAAEAAADEILSLPIFPAMDEDDVRSVVAATHKVIAGLSAAR